MSRKLTPQMRWNHKHKILMHQQYIQKKHNIQQLKQQNQQFKQKIIKLQQENTELKLANQQLNKSVDKMKMLFDDVQKRLNP